MMMLNRRPTVTLNGLGTCCSEIKTGLVGLISVFIIILLRNIVFIRYFVTILFYHVYMVYIYLMNILSVCTCVNIVILNVYNVHGQANM